MNLQARPEHAPHHCAQSRYLPFGIPPTTIVFSQDSSPCNTHLDKAIMTDQIDDCRTSQGKRAWTHQERVCVYMLWTEYHISNHERIQIFNQIFRAKQSSDDKHKSGMINADLLRRSPKSLSVEYSKRPRPGQKPSKAWSRLLSPPKTINEEAMRAQMRTRISNAISRRYESDDVGASTPMRALQQLTPPRTPSTVKHGDSKRTTNHVTEKRSAKALYMPSAFGNVIDDDEYVPSSKGTKRKRSSKSRQKSPVVLIPRLADRTAEPSPHQMSIQIDTSTREQLGTVCNKIRKVAPNSQSQDKATYPRMGNTPITLPLHKYQAAPPTDKDYNDISEAEGHPWLPPILFRYWNNGSSGINSTSGFKSGRTAFARAPPRPAPLCKDIEYTDVLEHLNPNRQLKHPHPSPFISTSNRLIWIVQQGLRKLGPDGRISVIDSSVLDRRAVYYTPPFHEQLHRHFAFDHGAQYWKGLVEHLVWNEIPEPAMIKTFTLSELCEFADSDPTVSRILRLETVKSDSRLDRTIRAFKKDKVKVTDQVAAAIARVVIFSA